MNKRPDAITLEVAESVVDELGLSDAFYWRKKWINARSRARAKGVECYLTFKQFMLLAIEAGLDDPENIGQQSHHFQLGRIGDKGDYKKGNCRFIPQPQNILERALNGGDKASADKRRGRTKETDEGLARLSAYKKGRTKHNDSGRMLTSKKLAKNFVVTSPTGKKHKDANLKDFCKKHDLGFNSMSRVCRGVQHDYFGWTGRYV